MTLFPPLSQYVMVVLSADHEGEGGTFALYALLCRYIGIHPARCARALSLWGVTVAWASAAAGRGVGISRCGVGIRS